MLIKTPVLVLNTSYEPIAVCTAKRALTLWAKGAAYVEEVHEELIHKRLQLRLPSVIRLRHYRRVPGKKHTVSRKNIFLRDRYICQYCAEMLPAVKLTLDHVIPKSKGGKLNWENLVTCCYPCNNRKDDQTVEEAGMTLLTTPRAMNLHMARNIMRTMGENDERWRKYLWYQ